MQKLKSVRFVHPIIALDSYEEMLVSNASRTLWLAEGHIVVEDRAGKHIVPLTAVECATLDESSPVRQLIEDIPKRGPGRPRKVAES